jgi:dihydrofolate reductase
MSEVMGGIMGKPFDLLLGRKTYEIFAAYWPKNPEDPGAKQLNEATKYVASRGSPTLDWGPAVLIEDDLADAVAELKGREGSELQVHGSGNLIQTLLENGLVDEFHVWVFPVLVGPGKRLFADGTVPASLRLVDTTTSTTGVVIATYEPAGELTVGSF